MPVGVQLPGFAESCSKLQLNDKFRSCACRYSATGATVQTVQLGLEAWAAHHCDDELWVFLRPCTQVQGEEVCPQGHGPHI